MFESKEKKSIPHVYINQCADCHGSNEQGGIYPINNNTLTPEQMRSIIQKGRGAMPSFDKLQEQQIDSLVLYIQNFRKK